MIPKYKDLYHFHDTINTIHVQVCTAAIKILRCADKVHATISSLWKWIWFRPQNNNWTTFNIPLKDVSVMGWIFSVLVSLTSYTYFLKYLCQFSLSPLDLHSNPKSHPENKTCIISTVPEPCIPHTTRYLFEFNTCTLYLTSNVLT